MTTLLLNGRVHSPSHPDATALAVVESEDGGGEGGGVVAWLGSDDVGRKQFPDAEVVDLEGAFVAPAFVDSHFHTTSTGLLLTGLDLTCATSLRHCLELVAGYAATHPEQLIWGHGWDETAWPGDGPPSAQDIDQLVGARPVYLARVDVHSAQASSALRDIVPGLTDATGFQPQLPLSAEAHHRVRSEARRLLAPGQLANARQAALHSVAAEGIVAVHECAGPDIGGLDDWLALRALEHGVEIVGYWGESVRTAAEARELMDATGARGLAGDLFVDGALGSHTAWLCEPYADWSARPEDTRTWRGNCYLDTDSVTEHLLACTDAGVTAGFHVIGDAAVGSVVAAFERVVERFGAPAVARCGHRLEHLEMVSAEQAAQLGAWGVMASVQPNFDALWGGDSGMYARRLGIERAAYLNPFALLASAGVPLAFGSDSPVTGTNPWLTLRAATNHQTQGSAISMRASFAAATKGAWRAGGVCDGVTGTLVAGAPASYAVWEIEGGPDGLDVNAPADAVQRWSTDPRSRVPALPRLDPADPLPGCLRTVHRGAVLYDRL